MKFNFELSDCDTEKLGDLLNGDRIKYLQLLTKCIASPSTGYLYQNIWTVQLCLLQAKRIDELEATIFGQEVEYTHSDEDIEELVPYYFDLLSVVDYD